MKNPFLNLLKTSWSYSGERKPWFVVTYLMFIAANVFIMLEPYVLGLFLNTIQEAGPNWFNDSVTFLTIYASLSLLFWIFHGNARVFERITAFHVSRNFRATFFDMLTSLPLKWHKDNHSGAIMSRIEKSGNALKGFVDDGFMFLEVIVKFILSLAGIFIFLPVSAFMALASGIFILFIILKFDKVLLKLLSEINEHWHKYDATFYDYVANIRTVITLRLEKLAKNETLRKFSKIFPVWRKNAIVNECKWFILSMMLVLLNFSILTFYLYEKFSSGTVILVGSLVTLYQYLQSFNNVFFDLAWKYEQLNIYNTDLKSAGIISDAYNALATNVRRQILGENWHQVTINNLFFKYEDEEHRKHNLILSNLLLKRGQKIAFVGASGSGKSTMMTLLRGLENANRVELDVDGKKYKSFQALSNLVTLIPQDPEIFDNTVEYNICAGISHEKSELVEACKIARFEDVLKKLPDGLNTNIKEKGVNLSGGEKQRLALARGIFAAKNSTILLLDEPTSSVDTENELQIYEGLFRKFKKHCIISSVHRLHLLPKFDYIYIFANGKVIEHGSFNGLLKSDGYLKKMWESYRVSMKDL